MDMEKDFMLKTIIIFSIALLGATVARYVFKLKDDNVIEEASEYLIYKETGYDIDLSPEKKDEHDKE